MAVDFAGGCRAFELREGEPAMRRKGLAVWRHVGRERGATAISFSVLELAPESGAAWRNRECDEVLGVLEGEGRLILDGGRHPLEPGTGIYVRPHDLVRIENAGRGPLTIASSRCPDPGPGIEFEDGPAPTARGPARLSSPVVRFEDQPTERAGDGRWFRVLVDAKAGCAQVTQFIGFIPAGRAPDHFHEYEEIVCILAGAGRFWSGGSSTPIAAGSCLYLPRRQPHCLENTGTENLQLCGLFYPSGSPAVRYRPDGSAG
jgi:mannose-6-phosphate isomerase-like protein (cupin superfamily)